MNHRFGHVCLVAFGMALGGCAVPAMSEGEAEQLGEIEEAITVGSMMDCPNGTGSACTVRNMPLLQQNSNLVDVDIPQGNKDVGCYDTSISTVINTMLANRTSGQTFGDRTLTFDSIVPGYNSGAPPLPTTKAYEQLSQFYRWVVAGVPLYFPEVLKDFDTAGTTVRSMPSGCNRDLYGNCSWTTSLRTGFQAAAFRDFNSGTHHVTNDYVKNLMNQGFATLIAYDRYTPKKVWDSSLGGYRMTFTWVGQHKVAVSGHQPGMYGLKINDVGDGKQYDVTVSTDMSAFPKIDGIAPSSMKKWDLPNGLSKQTFVRYSIDPIDADQVKFMAHLDGGSLSLPTSGPMRQVYSANTWGTGYDVQMPFKLNGEQYQIRYNSSTGAVRFEKFGSSAGGVTAVWTYTWGAGFTHMVPYYISGYPYFVAYNATTGDIHYDTFASNMQGPIIYTIKNLAKGFTSIEPFVMDGANYLLLYNKSTGAVRYEKLDSSGRNSTTTWTYTWGTGWTHFAPYSIAGVPHMVAYNSSNGTTHYDKIISNGVSILGTQTLPTALNIKTVGFDGPGNVIAYKSNGSTSIRRLALDGTTSQATFAAPTALLSGATGVTTFFQGGKTYAVLYNKDNGYVRSYELTMF